MPSKGLDLYAFAAEGFSISYTFRDAHNTRERNGVLAAQKQWQKVSEEIESFTEKVSVFGVEIPTPIVYFEGYFQFKVLQKGQQIYERSMRISSLSGSIDTTDLRNMHAEPVIGADYAIAFGLYNSDSGQVSGLTDRHQVYVSVTRPQHNWQQHLFDQYRAQHGGQLDALKLSQLLLPGSHDAGMYLGRLPVQIANMANTQKDPVRTQLLLGARYFDFRPGRLRPDFEAAMGLDPKDNDLAGNMLKIVKGLGIGALAIALEPFVGQLRHLHAFIPGATFEDFLQEVIEFLQANPQEIVVVRLKDSGFLTGAVETPSTQELQRLVTSKLAGTGVAAGDAADLNASVADLVRDQRRLVVLYRDAPLAVVSSYGENDPATTYHSYEAGNVVEALRQLNRGIEPGSDAKSKKTFQPATKQWLDAQLQLTPTALSGAIKRALMGTELGTSPLLATKPRTDAQTYPWVRNELGLTDGPLVTVCNDFYDNGLTDSVYHANLRRLGLKA